MLNELCDDGNPVTNTFRSQIAELFPSNQGEFMRHFPRLFSFINLETMLNADRRPVFEIETQKGTLRTIISTIEDVDKACKILGNISSLPPEKAKFYQEVFCPLSDAKLAKNTQSLLDGPWLNSSELAEGYTAKLSKLITSKQVLENYLTPLTDAGILVKDDSGRQNLYSKDGKLSVHTLDDLKSKVIEQSKVILLGVVSCLEELVRCSTEMGKTSEKITFNKQLIDLEQLIEHISTTKEQNHA